MKQLMEVYQIARDGGWRTLRELATRHGSIPESSLSARLRDLRKMGFRVERRPATIPSAPKGCRVFEYRVLPTPATRLD